MSMDRHVTRVLNDAARGDPDAAGRLLPLVYEELRKLAAYRMANESPGQTLQATALVHDAYLRLVDVHEPQHWSGRGHFFAAAAEAMRRILVERARGKARLKRGGERVRVDIDEVVATVAAGSESAPAEDLVALDEALTRLETHDAPSAEVVKLRCFAGLTMPLIAESLGIPLRTVERNWTYARTWLHRELTGAGRPGPRQT